jgi:Arc/MetJ-type ribon-helix-helix transcriptional regulator
VNSLAHILELTDEVERLVAEGRWGEASVTEAKRHALLVRYASGDGVERDALTALHARSKTLLTQVRRERSVLAAEAVRDFGGARAVDAYESLAAQASPAPGGSDHG